MRFKLDENIPREVEALFRSKGHDAETALSESLGGAADALLLAACVREKRVLVTLDLDFADIRLHPPQDYPGIWVLRPALHSVPGMLEAVRGALALLDTEQPARRLWIVEDERVRIRD
jgi:predicted nuclease of predicted toxin-antitoxin system